MSELVLDASVALEFLLGQDRAILAEGVLTRVGEDGAAAPSHWRLEVMNSLLTQLRRKVMDRAAAQALLEKAGAFRVTADHYAWTTGWCDVQRLAVDHRLTAYDAAYLELAIRRGLPLATFDQDLAAAARRENVPLLI